MIKIIVNCPAEPEIYDDSHCRNYRTNCVFEISDDASIESVFNAIEQAAVLEGYIPQSIENFYKERAQDYE